MAMQIQGTAAAANDRRPAASVPTPSGGVAAAGGNPVPRGGQNPPPAPTPAADLSRAIATLNQFLAESQRSFRFQVDDATGDTIVRIVNPDTGEVVRQIPSEDVLAAAHALRTSGNMIDARA